MLCIAPALGDHVYGYSNDGEANQVEPASRLEDAFNKSKSVFLEEANYILRSTIADQSPETSTASCKHAKFVHGEFN